MTIRGATRADLPVERPTQFKPVSEHKAATALGITIPQAALSRADGVSR